MSAMSCEGRWHPRCEEWVIVAGRRQNRPWSDEVVERGEAALPTCMADCYPRPGNRRVGGRRNDQYNRAFVFDNDHPYAGFNAPHELSPPGGIYLNRPATVISRVVCYTPHHNVTLAELEPEEVETLVRVWREQYIEIGRRPEINHILIFENKGEVVAVSNPHPHCQVYATNFAFKTIET
jgi:UDPglucose--hexose-1-phosphate uridylyltransferase